MSVDPEFFVKFRKWNNHTIDSLISKKVRLSRVFDFNDFNEYNFSMLPNEYVHCDYKKFIRKQIEPLLCDDTYKKTLLQFAKDTGRIDKILQKINDAMHGQGFIKLFEEEFEKDLFMTFCEHYVAYHMAIFCISDINVFEGDAAQLMFAHYAENCSGVALIYKNKGKKGIEKIKYREMNARKGIISGSISKDGIKPDEKNFLHKFLVGNMSMNGAM